MGIKGKILVPMVLLAIVVAMAILGSNVVAFLRFTAEMAEGRVITASKVAESHLDFLKEEATASVMSIAENPRVADAINRNDREAMVSHITQLQGRTKLEFCTVTDAEGTVIFRTHRPEQSGDSVLDQANIRSAIAGIPLTTIEKGTEVRMSVRAGVPIFSANGVVIGVVSAGYRMDNVEFVDRLKDLTGCEATIFLGDERIATTIVGEDGRRAVGTRAEARVSELVLSGEAYTGEANVLGRATTAQYTPLSDSSAQVIGMLFTGEYVAETMQTVWEFIRGGALATVALTLAAIVVMLIITGYIVRPIRAMAGAARALAHGDISVDVRVSTKDEMGTLAVAFSEMIENTRRQTHAIEQIAGGGLSIALKERSEKDTINRALLKLDETIRAQAAEISAGHERVRIMLDSTPLAARLWNRNLELLECNEAAVKLFGLTDKEEYMERYFDLSPSFQPDGVTTAETLRISVGEAFEKGESHREWMYRMPDGTAVPCENTLVRVPYAGDYVVAAYSRDLRAEQAMTAAIRHHSQLLNVGNQVAASLFNADDDQGIEGVLLKNMEALAAAVHVNRVHIMQNEMIDGALHFTCKHVWLDAQNADLAVMPGMTFPYSIDPSWERDLPAGRCINGPIKDFPPQTRDFFAAFGLRSVLVIPVFAQGAFWGCVRYSDCVADRVFTEEEVSLLRTISMMMATAINRNEQTLALREAHSRIRMLVNATPLGFNLWTRDMRNIETNETSVALFGLSSQEEYLERFFDLSPEYQSDGRKSRARIREILDRALETGYVRVEWAHRRLDGTPIPAEVTLVRLKYAGDYVVAAYVRDLREYKKMIADIAQRDHLLETVNQAADTLFRSDPDDFGEAMRQCMGMMARAVGADRAYLHKDVSADTGKVRSVRLNEWPYREAERGAVYGVLCDGRIHPISDRLCSGESVRRSARDLPAACRECLGIGNAASTMVVPIFLDNAFWGFFGFDRQTDDLAFTENEESVMRSASLLIVNALLRNEYTLNIRDTSAKLEAALADARVANETKSNFLAHMSHEIRTPLNAVIGLSELTLGKKELVRETRDNLEKIYSAGSTILSIVNDILDISKIESGKFELNPIQYDVPSLINDIVTLNIIRIGDKLITFKLTVDENFPSALYGDDLRVKQIFSNLLSNAFKYTQVGEVEWSIRFALEGEDVRIDSFVRDTGIGIKPEDIPKLFADYNQLDMRTNRSVGGTGLGLSITKSLVERMGGEISVESEYGKGSTFRTRFRQRLARSAPIGKDVAANLMNMRYVLSKRVRGAQIAHANLSYACVLVVDDVLTNLDVVRGMLRPYNLQVDCATSGQQAIDMIRAQNPRYNAIFMDHMMPEMDGIEATRIIREEIGTDYARTVPIIALTANAIAGSEEMFLNRGFQAFISKPIDVMKLDLVLREWVRNKDLEEEGAPAPAEEDASARPLQSLLEGVPFPGVDIESAAARFGGRGDGLMSVLHSYIQNTRSLTQDLQSALDALDLPRYAILIHGIKGASYGVFAQGIGDAAQALEEKARNGDIDSVRTAHSAFITMANEILTDLGESLDRIGWAKKKPPAAEPDPGTLEDLRAACAAFDMDGADQAMDRLEAFRYERGGALVAWLRRRIDEMDFERISMGDWPAE